MLLTVSAIHSTDANAAISNSGMLDYVLTKYNAAAGCYTYDLAAGEYMDTWQTIPVILSFQALHILGKNDQISFFKNLRPTFESSANSISSLYKSAFVVSLLKLIGFRLHFT